MTAKAGLFIIALFTVLLVFIFSAFLIPDALRQSLTWLFRLAVGGLGALLVVIIAYTAIDGIERVKTRRAERQEVEHRADVMVIDAPHNHRIIVHERGGVYRNLTLDSRWVIQEGTQPSELELRQWGIYNQLLQPRVIGREGAQLLPEPEPQAIDILAALRRTPRALIVGASDAGKSTILLWLAQQMVTQGEVVIIDPHSFPDKWPGGCTVIGTGSRHDLIEEALNKLVTLMVQRYREIGRGDVAECGHPQVGVIVDEWMSIAEQCHNSKPSLIRLLTESRKAAFTIYVGSHSHRVRSLGLDGRGDLREGFEIYHLEINKQTGERRAWLEVDGDETPLVLPGPYAAMSNSSNGGQQAHDLEAVKVLDMPPDATLTPEPGSDDELVCQMYQNGDSMRQITEAAWGKFGTFYNDKVAQILLRYGVEK